MDVNKQTFKGKRYRQSAPLLTRRCQILGNPLVISIAYHKTSEFWV
jgi:hypothetical protein